jgi:hypothetical protein
MKEEKEQAAECVFSLLAYWQESQCDCKIRRRRAITKERKEMAAEKARLEELSKKV